MQYKPAHPTAEGALVQIYEHKDPWSGCVSKGEVEGRSLLPDINDTKAQMQNDAAKMGANSIFVHSIMEAYGSGSAYACPADPAAPAKP